MLPHGVEALTALGLGDALSAVGAQPFRGILYRCGGVVARGDFEGGAPGFGVQRGLLDDVVRRRAVDVGAAFVHGTARKVALPAQASPGGESVSVELACGSVVRGRFLIGADGPRSMVRHALDLDCGAPKDGRYAVRRHFRLPDAVPLPDRVEVTVVDGFEIYLTPVGDGVVNIAALCERRVFQGGSGALNARLDDLLARAPEEATAVLRGAVPLDEALACGPLRVKARAVHRGPALLVGDAAGYVDALTGEGMSLALRTAAFAVDAIADVAGGALERPSFRRYAKRRADAFRDHALLTHGLVFLARHRPLAVRAVARLAREPALFSRLLAVNDGRRTLASLGVVDALKLAVGSKPPA